MADKKLTDKQKAFVDEYLIDLNATRAYLKIYNTVKSEDVAGVNASRLLGNAKVKECLEKRMKDREKRTEITQDKVLAELAQIAFANGADFAKVVERQCVIKGQAVFNDDGSPKMYNTVDLIPTDKISKDKRKAISSIKEGKYGIEVAACDKVRALELLGRHLGMFKDKIEVSGNINNPYEGLTTDELKKLVKDG